MSEPYYGFTMEWKKEADLYAWRYRNWWVKRNTRRYESQGLKTMFFEKSYVRYRSVKERNGMLQEGMDRNTMDIIKKVQSGELKNIKEIRTKVFEDIWNKWLIVTMVVYKEEA